MTFTPQVWLALDVGGANLKAAHTSGAARVVPFALWRAPDDLGRRLSDLAASLPSADRVALTMTAELCDCYPTKAAGVLAVLDAVQEALPGRPIHVWCIDGGFHDAADVREAPRLAAAANWLALATHAARLVPEGDGLVIDVGSTTTDVIPLKDGVPSPTGRTDAERLRSGELVYAGVRRTPVCALATELPFRGRATGLAAELFATTLDVYLTLGDLVPDPDDRATADGRSATVGAARDRLARMVGADRDEFSAEDAEALARAADDALMSRLTASALRACQAAGVRPRAAVVAGSGEFLARRLAERVLAPGGIILGLGEAWGPVASSASCATALLALARERIDGVAGTPTTWRRPSALARPPHPGPPPQGGREPDDDSSTRDEGLLLPPPLRGRAGVGGQAPRTPPIMIKVGGSLLDWAGLPGRLSEFLAARRDRRAVLVAGGGRVADIVRDLDRAHSLGDDRAHHLALRALDLTAHLLAALVPGLRVADSFAALGPVWDAGLTPVLAPRRFLDEDERASADPLAHSWDVTSDAIAARVAEALGAEELVLLKSAPLPLGASRAEAARLGLVDPAFPEASRRLKRLTYLDLRGPEHAPSHIR